MSKKVNIFGGVKFWGRFSLSLPRAIFKNWDWAAWFWFAILGSLLILGLTAIVIT